MRHDLKRRVERLLLFFLLPLLLTMVADTVPFVEPQIGSNILLALVIALLADMWSGLDLRSSNRPKTIILRDHRGLMERATVLVSEIERAAQIVFVYQAYPLASDIDSKYMLKTIDAIERGRIEQYSRLMNVRDKTDIHVVLEMMKKLAESDKARECTHFYVSFRSVRDSLSFLLVGDSQCLVAFPNVDDPPRIHNNHCGFYVEDAKFRENLKDVFKHNRDAGSGSLALSLPDSEDDAKWKRIESDLCAKLEAMKTESIQESIR